MNDCVLEDGFGQRPSVSYVRVGFFPKQLCCRGSGGCGKWPVVAPALPRPSRPPRFDQHSITFGRLGSKMSSTPMKMPPPAGEPPKDLRKPQVRFSGPRPQGPGPRARWQGPGPRPRHPGSRPRPGVPRWCQSSQKQKRFFGAEAKTVFRRRNKKGFPLQKQK